MISRPLAGRAQTRRHEPAAREHPPRCLVITPSPATATLRYERCSARAARSVDDEIERTSLYQALTLFRQPSPVAGAAASIAGPRTDRRRDAAGRRPR